MSESKFNIGLLGIMGKLAIDNGFLKFSNPYAKRFNVRVSDIETVTVDTLNFGKAKLKIVGKGSVLAETDLPVNWAEKCQRWILSQTEK